MLTHAVVVFQRFKLRAPPRVYFCCQNKAEKFCEMAELEKSAYGFHGAKEVETPMGTPSPPGAASTVARPPPRPRRFPLINFPDDEINGMIKSISIVSVFRFEILA